MIKIHAPIHRSLQTPFHLLIASLLSALPATADVRLPKIFTDNMMLQRNQPVRVWGWAEAGEAVSVALAGKSASTKADAKGEWKVEMPALKAGENLELSVKGNNRLSLKNILIGDLWICSGQSNMEMSLGQCLGAADDIKSANLPTIRSIKIDRVQVAKPLADAPVASPWQVCSPATAGSITAVGFYFAREIQQKTKVPIGIIDSNWGGTRIEPWIAPENPETEAQLNGGLSGIYNAMIHPFLQLPIKGALWYQGESNGDEGDTYFEKMKTLIGGWRKLWKQGDFPFYFVQLASYQGVSEEPAGGNGWAKLREAQTKSLTIPNTGMAVILDTVPLTEKEDIHPKNKFDVGLRLARWALVRDYGQKVEASGPLFKALKIEGGKARLAFDHLGTGLMIGKKEARNPAVEDKQGKLKRFAIAGADKQWFWADAVIVNNTISVSSPSVKEPVAVRYAYQMNPDGANLYNREGLPASPFRTDAW